MSTMSRWIEMCLCGNWIFLRSVPKNNFSEKGEKKMFIVKFFQMGGFFMFPILLVLAVGIAISVERWIHLKRTVTENRKMWDQVHPLLAEGDFDKAREMVNDDKSAISQMLAMGLARQGAVRR